MSETKRASITRARITPLGEKSKQYTWTAKDIATMPRREFVVLWNRDIKPRYALGLKNAQSPSGGNIRGAAWKASVTRAKEMGMKIPTVKVYDPKKEKQNLFTKVDFDRLRSAILNKKGCNLWVNISEEVGLGISTLHSIINDDKRVKISKEHFARLCAWLGRQPKEFKL